MNFSDRLRLGGLSLGVATLILTAAGPSWAAETTVALGNLSGPVTTGGTLGSEGDAVLNTFSLSSDTALTVFTTSYGGGTNLDGSTTTAGGFEPNVMLFNSATGFVVAQTTGSDPLGKADASTGLLADSYFSDPDVSAGNYILSISNWGTTGDPAGGFTDVYGSRGFADVGGNARGNNFTLNISSAATPPAATPEPGSFWLTLPALAVAGLMIRKRCPKVTSQVKQ